MGNPRPGRGRKVTSDSDSSGEDMDELPPMRYEQLEDERKKRELARIAMVGLAYENGFRLGQTIYSGSPPVFDQ